MTTFIIIVVLQLVVLIAVLLARVVGYELDQTPPMYVNYREREHRPFQLPQVSEARSAPVAQVAMHSTDDDACNELLNLKRAAQHRR